MHRRLLAPALIALALAAGTARAEEVRLDQGGLTRLANLELAPGKTLRDGVVLITHGTLAHHRMEIIAALQENLLGRGFSSLAHTLTLGESARRGMYDCGATHRHRQSDALPEIGAWVDWLKQRGAERIVLAGHSRGGYQTARYAAEHDAPAIRAVVLIAPTHGTGLAAEYARAHGKALAPLLQAAQDALAKDPQALLSATDFLYCKGARVSAAAFVDYYREDPALELTALLRRSAKPVLVVAAGKDEVVTGLPERIGPLADGRRIRLVTVPDTGHFFQDLYGDDLADAVAAFLGGG
jgi:pimeloyl-ACP methyl ester carboxylesterase